jgi:three-Cys-motif partner protein
MEQAVQHESMGIPGVYDGREQSLIKHALLKGYLEKLVLIIGMSRSRVQVQEICYVDCFAGPWSVDEAGMHGTSIAISLEILARCNIELKHNNSNVQLRALFVEKNADAYAKLSGYLKASTPEGLVADSINGDFLDQQERILQWCGKKSFTFFFIDPTGWSQVGISQLAPMLRRPRSEFLINLMYDWVNRTVSNPEWRSEMCVLLGEIPDVDGLEPAQREKILADSYRANLCASAGAEAGRRMRSAYVRIMDPNKERAKYHLVYLTRHPRGIIEFMLQSQSVDLVQRRVRAQIRSDKRIDESGTSDLFGASSYVDLEHGRADSDEVEQYWRDFLGPAGKVVGEEEFASMLEQTNWLPDDFQQALGRLIVSGEVSNRASKRLRPKRPLHWQDNEFLELNEGKA